MVQALGLKQKLAKCLQIFCLLSLQNRPALAQMIHANMEYVRRLQLASLVLVGMATQGSSATLVRAVKML